MDFWDKVAGIYDLSQKLNGKVYKQMEKGVRRLVPENSLVLEVAAGTGALSAVAAEKATAVVCTDQSEEMLKKAESKFKAKGLTNIYCDKRNIFDLIDNDETYDVVIAANVLHLIKNPENAVRELYRVTKKGGRLILPTYLLGETDERMLRLTDFYKKVGFTAEHEYTVDSYLEMLYMAVEGDFRFKYIDGSLPLGFVVIKKD